MAEAAAVILSAIEKLDNWLLQKPDLRDDDYAKLCSLRLEKKDLLVGMAEVWENDKEMLYSLLIGAADLWNVEGKVDDDRVYSFVGEMEDLWELDCREKLHSYLAELFGPEIDVFELWDPNIDREKLWDLRIEKKKLLDLRIDREKLFFSLMADLSKGKLNKEKLCSWLAKKTDLWEEDNLFRLVEGLTSLEGPIKRMQLLTEEYGKYVKEVRNDLRLILDFLNKLEDQGSSHRHLHCFMSDVVEMAQEVQHLVHVMDSDPFILFFQIINHYMMQGHTINSSASCLLKFSHEIEFIHHQLQETEKFLRKFRDDETSQINNVRKELVGPSPTYSESDHHAVGLKDDVELLLHNGETTICIRGLPGIGKTTLAREFYSHPEILDGFECRAWVRLSSWKLSRKDLLIKLIRQFIHSERDDTLIEKMENKALQQMLHQHLQDKPYVLVLDDVSEETYLQYVFRTLPQDQLQRHPSPPISINKQQVESLTQNVTFFQEFLEDYDSPHSYSIEADPLEMSIADAAYAAEDVIEFYIVDAIHLRRSSVSRWSSFFNFCGGQSSLEMGNNADVDVEGEDQIRRRRSFCQDLQKVIEDMDLIKKTVMEMPKEKSISAVQARKNFSFTEKMKNKSTMMVGFDDVLLQLLDKLTRGPLYRQVIPITGMGGIGKTTLARKIFENALVKEYFDICAWVTISQQYSIHEIISKIHSQVTGKKSEESNKSEEELGEELYKYLCGRRYLIIMDDIWSIDVWETMKFILGDSNSGSRIIVTTRQSYLTSHLTDSFCLDMEFLDELNSWNLFSKTVFREENFPPQLEKIGKKIVKICKGLPLSIVVIGGLLAKSERSQKHWEQIELKLNSTVNSENDEYCLRILKMSFKHLPAYLKPIFLYMGIFEEDTKIHVSTLIKLWVSEGFLKPEIGKSLETIGEGFLKDLIDRNLILIDGLGSIGNLKFCKIHDLLRDLCLKEAEKERFYHVIGQHGPQGIHNGRRVFYPRRSSNDALKCMSHVRSVTSWYHRVRVLPNGRLLRILNAYGMYGKFFPVYRLENVIHELVNSRYLSILVTRKTKFPAAVNFLWNLQTLRVESVTSKQVFIAPVEIWKMSQLRHVEFKRGNMYLPDPPSDDIDTVILENLETLKGVRNFKFGEKVINRIPNIKRLKISYEKVRENRRHDGDYYCVSNLEFLHKLESFTCNLYKGSDVFLQNINFPHSLKKLDLALFDSSIGWEDMLEQIGSLPLLQKLKLRGGYFKTHKLETIEGQFPSLKSLCLVFCDCLEQWMMEESSHFPCLERVKLVFLTELEEIPASIGEIPTLQSIKLYDCNDSAVKSAKKIIEEQEELQGEEQLSFHVEVFIQKGKEALKSMENSNFKVNILG